MPVPSTPETAHDLARVRAFIDTHEWHFAKTMPQIPHWYCLRKDKGDVEEFLWFAQYIKEHCTPGQFYGKTYYYYYLDGYKYWSMDERPEDCDLINRDKVPEGHYSLYNRCSFILTGSLESVLDIFRRYIVPVQKSDFSGDKGYVFMFRNDVPWHEEFMKELSDSPDIFAVSCPPYRVGEDSYSEFCKDSIIPVNE